ncbi:MAG: hypothetical protein J5966_00510, partial [Lachnospiraceae bacterium]|nr:hypothetical protein [Lachnospiraceae bacterium]
GGSEKWAKRMRQMFPEWSFITVGDNSLGAVNAIERADWIYVYTGMLKHEQYYRVADIAAKNGKALAYLGGTNVEENLRRFYADLCTGIVGK